MAATPLGRRPSWAEVDLGAVRHNVAAVAALVAPAAVCAVVKADGYGHGAVPVARAALEAGATWLAVALPAEGRALRGAGIDAPVLVLSEPSPEELDDLVDAGLRATVGTQPGVEELAKAVARAGADPVRVHVKVDTGMRRVGAQPAEVPALVDAVRDRPELVLEGVWTHCAVADEPAHPFTLEQLARFEAVLAELRAAGVEPPLVHAANSAAAVELPCARYDLVRIGIAAYGLAPSPALEGRLPLRPALSVRSRVSHVKVVPDGERLSYGLRYRCEGDRVIATVPIGYADGVVRRLSSVGAEVLVGGRRRPIAGTITMDQLMVDCGAPGDDGGVAVGDEVVLIGRQGDAEVTAAEWAARLDTIAYEVVCGIGPRVPRRHVG